MPQADDELRKAMQQRFGDIDSAGPENYLKEQGYSLSPDWEWSRDDISDLSQMRRDEFECLMFLVHEWDYGSLRT